MSDTEDFATLYEKNRKAQAEANAINKAVLFDALCAAGITSVTVNFNGEGDSGQIEEITAYANGNPHPLPDVQLSIQQVEWGTGKQDNHETAIRDAVEQLCYDSWSWSTAAGRTTTGPSASSPSRWPGGPSISNSMAATAISPPPATHFKGENHGASLPPLPLQREAMGRYH